MKANNNDSIKRFGVIFGLILLAATYVLGKALDTIFTDKHEYWETVDKKLTKENIPVPAERGNILAADGQILSGSIPEYVIRLDFKIAEKDSATRAKLQAWRDSMFINKLDSLSDGLAQIFPDYSAEWFRKHLLKGKKKNGYSFRVYPRYANYIQYLQCTKLPFFCEPPLKSGFHADEIMQRKKTYGSLAPRTIGDLKKGSDSAKSGLELGFDSILRGTPGVEHRSKVRNKNVSFVDRQPENGHDLLTTLDINLQDFADQALRKKLYEVNGEIGVTVVMEVKTGDVKAIVNLTRCQDGKYYEVKNNALSDLMEPGSTFKTASILVGMDDGVIKKDDRVDCTGGICKMYTRLMKDHNWRKGGYGVLTVSEILEQSSNIGVSHLIDKAYHNNPQRFVDRLRRAGVGIDLELPIPGGAKPVVPQPNSKIRYWSPSDLPWMSIGYVTSLPPISTLTFYNAIANNGRMMKPRFVKAEMADGVVVREFPPVVIKESIVEHKQSLDNIREFLANVVSKGLGKKAGNGGRYFNVSGKTGTAQMNYGRGEIMKYMVSFCGYFPSEAPQYSCIVCIVKTGLPASGGGQCGPVFSEISQYIMANGMFRNVEEAWDSTSVMTPDVATLPSDTITYRRMPNVLGMGAKDAVHILQQCELKVRLTGAGRVAAQSIKPGWEYKKGKNVTLTLE
ncbi:MAG: transpeptidase family protein [Bacteroidaceae bacterium]|nr:transpeptidase family protein [Bacteroidaceae bacterium]